MSRFVLASAVVSLFALSACTGCSKSAARQEAAGGAQGGATGGTKIAVPGGDTVGGAGTTGAPEGASKGADESRLRLLPEEGKLAVEAPADAKPNTEATAKITVTAGKEFKLNTEFPTKVTIETPSGVTVAKAELKAGGHDKAKGDAEVFDEQTLTFAIKMTPTAAGAHTVNGTFKFAVCDKAGTTCLAKKEPITIQVAAK